MEMIEIQFINSTDDTLSCYQASISGVGSWQKQPPQSLLSDKTGYGVCNCEPGAFIIIVYKPDEVHLLTVQIVLDAQNIQLNTTSSPGYTTIANSHWNSSKYIVAVEYRQVNVAVDSEAASSVTAGA